MHASCFRLCCEHENVTSVAEPAHISPHSNASRTHHHASASHSQRKRTKCRRLGQRSAGAKGMIRGARAGSSFLRSASATGARGRCSGHVSAAATRMGVINRPHVRSKWAFESTAGQGRFMSAAPGSLDEKKDEPAPEGFMKRLMGKESCVVREW